MGRGGILLLMVRNVEGGAQIEERIDINHVTTLQEAIRAEWVSGWQYSAQGRRYL